MKESRENENKGIVKAFQESSSFMRNNEIVSGKVEEILSFNITKGEFHNSIIKIAGIARISIDQLSQLYEFKGCASENEIIGRININKTH